MELWIIRLVPSLVAGAAGGSALYLLYRGRARYLLAAGTSLVTALVLLTVTLWLADRPAPAIQVTIDAPSNSALVDVRTQVEGKVSSADAKVFVLVHPLATDTFWVQNIPQVSQDRRWRVEAFFGTEAAGRGESFEILAVATNESQVLRILRGTNLTPGTRLPTVSPYLAKSQTVTVRRRTF